MAAINKINTNFHYKFEDLHKELEATLKNVCDAIIPKVNVIQCTCEELRARVDDLEANIPEFKKLNNSLQQLVTTINPAIADLRKRITVLETTQTSICDDMSTIKGFIQVLKK